MTDKTEGLKIKDITGAWVKANFDIDKERKTTMQPIEYNNTEYIADPGDSGMDFDQWVQKINDWFDKQIEKLDNPTSIKRKIRVGEDYDYYSCDSCVDHCFEVFLEAGIPEDDSTVINRIKNREKQKIRRRNEKAKAEKAKAKKIENEKKLLRQLMIKYKGEL